MPYFLNLPIKITWLTASNAFFKSGNIAKLNCMSFRVSYHLSVLSINDVMVVQHSLKAGYSLLGLWLPSNVHRSDHELGEYRDYRDGSKIVCATSRY